jgi:hypothetical protein
VFEPPANAVPKTFNAFMDLSKPKLAQRWTASALALLPFFAKASSAVQRERRYSSVQGTWIRYVFVTYAAIQCRAAAVAKVSDLDCGASPGALNAEGPWKIVLSPIIEL